MLLQAVFPRADCKECFNVTALPFELVLAFLTTTVRNSIKKLPSLGGLDGTNTQGGRPAAPWDLAPWLAGSYRYGTPPDFRIRPVSTFEGRDTGGVAGSLSDARQHHHVVRPADVIVNSFLAVAAIVRVTPMLPGRDPCPPDVTHSVSFPKHSLLRNCQPAGPISEHLAVS